MESVTDLMLDATCLSPSHKRFVHLILQARYRLLRSFFVQTTNWSSFDPFSSQKAETFKQSGKAIYRAQYLNVLLVGFNIPPAEIATTMHELQEERAKLELDSDKLGVLFKEMIQMCLWLIPFNFSENWG